MPKVSIQVGKRVRIDCNYDDYKEWERILTYGLKGPYSSQKGLLDHIESTTLLPDGSYWKSILFKVGETEYRIGGPIMPKEKGTH